MTTPPGRKVQTTLTPGGTVVVRCDVVRPCQMDIEHGGHPIRFEPGSRHLNGDRE